jgi:hypothetical protein
MSFSQLVQEEPRLSTNIPVPLFLTFWTSSMIFHSKYFIFREIIIYLTCLWESRLVIQQVSPNINFCYQRLLIFPPQEQIPKLMTNLLTILQRIQKKLCDLPCLSLSFELTSITLVSGMKAHLLPSFANLSIGIDISLFSSIYPNYLVCNTSVSVD